MRLLVILIVIEVIWVLGWTIVTREDMLLQSLGDWARKKKSKIWKPLISCHWCMSSIHTIFAYAFAYGLGFINKWEPKLLVLYPLVVAASSFIVGFLIALLIKTEQAGLYYNNSGEYYFLKNEATKEALQNDNENDT